MRANNVRAAGSVLRRRALSAGAPPPSLMPAVKLLVCDMAGTTVDEGGLVYTTLQSCMNAEGLGVSEEDLGPWYGAQKSAVIAHFASRAGFSSAATDSLEIKINATFEDELMASYMSSPSLALIDPSLPDYFADLRGRGVKIGLNTGYPHKLQNALLEKLRLGEMVDGYVSSQDVKAGRPSPFMVHRLMEMLDVQDVRAVAKAGDTERDIEEGLNAGCGQVIGVLSGADSREALLAVGAHVICDNITKLPLLHQSTS